jgi:hypothetical protein
MDEDFIKYIQACVECQRNKSARHKSYGLLQPLELAYAPWQSIAMAFITDLPLSDGCDQLWVVIDRYTKMSHFIPLKKNSKKAPDLAVIFAKEIWRLHGLPSDIISDRDSRFTSAFWKSLLSSLGIRPRMSTAFHPQTDGQTERLNQTIEAFLRAYVNHKQNDWVELLPLAEFAYNNTITTAHGMTPFYANYGYHPSSGSVPPGSNTLPVHSIAYGHWMKAIYEDCKKELEKTSNRMKKYADKTRPESPRYNKGDLVMLNGKNIKIRHPSQKLDHKLYGPFEILESISPTAIRLRLPKTWKIDPIFHVSLIEPFITGGKEVNIDEILQSAAPVESAPEYDVDRIMGSSEKNGKVLYLVKWKGWPAKKNWTREPFDNFYSVGAQEELQKFYRHNPDAPRDSRLQTK